MCTHTHTKCLGTIHLFVSFCRVSCLLLLRARNQKQGTLLNIWLLLCSSALMEWKLPRFIPNKIPMAVQNLRLKEFNPALGPFLQWFCFSPSLQDFWNLRLQHQSATFNNPKEKKYGFLKKQNNNNKKQRHYLICEGWNVRKFHLSRTWFFCMCHAIKFQTTEGKFKVTNKMFSPFPLSAFKQDLMGGKNG